MDIIMLELNNNYIIDQITYTIIKRYLKRNSYQKYYDNIPRIIYQLKGDTSLHVSIEHQNNLKALFIKISAIWDEHFSQRGFIIPFNIIFHEMLRFLHYHQFLIFFPLPKNKKKLEKYAKLWEFIMEKLV